MPTSFQVGNVTIGGELFLIAGPCVIESEAHSLKMAESIAGIARALKLPYIFKASYDKANRTSIRSFRGPGLKEGLRVLGKVAASVRVPVLTDVHRTEDVERVAEVVDVIQIPAFLCRQTDLIVAAAKTERGSSFGYTNLVVEMRSLPIMRQFAPVVFDATHSVQLPSASANGEPVSGGQPEFIPVLARAAVAAGVDGVFVEVHDNPQAAKSDGPNALPLSELRQVLVELLGIYQAARQAAQP